MAMYALAELIKVHTTAVLNRKAKGVTDRLHNVTVNELAQVNGYASIWSIQYPLDTPKNVLRLLYFMNDNC
jgi:hypothetical protein